jgi:gluconolactonase
MRRLLLASIAGLATFAAISDARAQSTSVVATGLAFPEGTVFVDNTLYFVDYATSDVLRLVGGHVEKVWHQDSCGANGLIVVPRGLLVACYENGTVALINRDGRLLETISRDDAGHTFNRPNDLAADTKGGVYFSASGSDSEVPGKVFYLAPDKRVREVASNIHNSNGLVVSLDARLLYVAESDTDRLLVFSIAADATLKDRRDFVRLSDILGDGRRRRFTPDGVRIDKHGRLFVGLYEGGGFAVIGADAKLIRRVDVPGTHHANLAISPDGRFVFGTTAYDKPGGSYRGELYRAANPVPE